MNNKKRYIIVYIAIALLVAFDMLTKVLTNGIKDLTIISGFISFDSTYNKGAAWSLFSNHTIILALLSMAFVAIAIIIDIKLKFKNKNKLYDVAFVLIVSGALGNGIDRTFLGCVRDFIRLDFVYFPIFNLADMLLVIGVIILAIFILFYDKFKSEKQSLNEVNITKNDLNETAENVAENSINSENTNENNLKEN